MAPHLNSIAPSALAVLGRIAGTPLCDRFCLGGGTALAWHLGHRLSADLDWFTRERFDPLVLRGELPAACGCEVRQTAANTLLVMLDGVKVDFLRYDYRELAPPVAWNQVRLFSVPDIAAMKLSALANRGAKKDFYDVARLLEHYPLPELLEWYEAKFSGFSTLPVLRSLTWFEDAEADPDPVSLCGATWESVKKSVRNAAANL